MQVMGWDSADVRYMNLANLKVEITTPEPAVLGLVAILGLLAARKRQ